MNTEKQLKNKKGGSVNLGQHQAQCTVCSHPERQEIEEEWISWHYADDVAARYGISRDAIYRHARALDLYSIRRKNIRRALEGIAERVSRTRMSGSEVLSAIKALVKINSEGQGAEHIESTDPTKLFKRMSPEERAAFAQDGSLPDWFSRAKGATPDESQEGEPESQVPEPERLQ
jgi:hypothetical protein